METVWEGGRCTTGKTEPPPIPAPVRTDLGLGGKRCEGAREGPLLQVRESAPLPPTSGGRVTLRKLLSRTGGRTCRPRPRAKNLEKEKSCQASGPASPATRPARPLPAGGGPGRCCPSPSPAPTLPPPGRAPCLLAPFAETRPPPFPTHLPGRLRRSPLTPPAATVHTHRFRTRTQSPSHTARPRLQGGPHIMRHSHATCPARARAPIWREAR